MPRTASNDWPTSHTTGRTVTEALARFAAGEPVRVDRFRRLCDEFEALPPGTVVKFVRGTDFTTRPESFRQALLVEFKHRGTYVSTTIREDGVYAKVGASPPF
jgi:hypothetical protein